MSALLRLKEQGKIRAIGVSNATLEQLAGYLRLGQVDSDQEKYSILDREHEATLLPFCREMGIAVLAYSPLANGLLTGKIGPDRVFQPGDLRHDNPRFSAGNRERIAAQLDRIRPIAGRYGITLTQLMIAWTLAQPGVTHALVGARDAKQALENAGAGDVMLTTDEIAGIHHAFKEPVERTAV
jgi:aryl-alcohol dehydrogenase-like predicted oxidoreductase